MKYFEQKEEVIKAGSKDPPNNLPNSAGSIPFFLTEAKFRFNQSYPSLISP